MSLSDPRPSAGHAGHYGISGLDISDADAAAAAQPPTTNAGTPPTDTSGAASMDESPPDSGDSPTASNPGAGADASKNPAERRPIAPPSQAAPPRHGGGVRQFLARFNCVSLGGGVKE
jgi:hypothetical protein